MARRIMVGFVGLVVACALFGAGYLANDLAGSDAKSVPTQTTVPAAEIAVPTVQPVITGGEAAAKVEIDIRQTDPFPEDAINVGVSCDAEDFNSSTSEWIVKCLVENRVSGITLNSRYRVDATTGAVTPINISFR